MPLRRHLGKERKHLSLSSFLSVLCFGAWRRAPLVPNPSGSKRKGCPPLSILPLVERKESQKKRSDCFSTQWGETNLLPTSPFPSPRFSFGLLFLTFGFGKVEEEEDRGCGDGGVGGGELGRGERRKLLSRRRGKMELLSPPHPSTLLPCLPSLHRLLLSLSPHPA